MKARALLLGIALVFVTGSHAFAQDDEEEEIDPTSTGWYVGGSAGLGIQNFSEGIHSDQGLGGGVTLGHRASEFLSFEIETMFLEDFRVRPNSAAEIDIWTSTLNFRMHFPMEDSPIEPYMTYGVGVMDVEVTGTAPGGLRKRNNTDMLLKAGVGVAYQLTNEVSLYGAGTYALPLGNIKAFDHFGLTAGILYKFGDDDDDDY